MPVMEADPWRVQYFEGVACPEDVRIPTEDADCWQMYPPHRAVYDKLWVAGSQGLECAPHGVMPGRFPVFSKPAYNLRGMGSGTRVIRDAQEYARVQAPGHMWMTLLAGDHVSTDVAVVDGEPRWWRHVIGAPIEGGMFDFWTVLAEPRPEIEAYCGEWLRRHLRGFTGIVNLETIGGRIIEAHLRMSDQWPDLYGPGWVEAAIGLYAHGRWDFPDAARRPGYSVVLFGGHGPRYRKPPPEVVAEIAALPEISSVQITFHEDRAPELHAMPPGGFRLAILNCWDLDAGCAARERLALHFWSTQRLRRRSKGPPRRAGGRDRA